ncbi:MAG: adenylyltransferase/cytidyltransferase family protein [Bacillota bacterium]
MNYQMRDCITPKELEDVKQLLEKQGLRFEDKVTLSIGFYDENQLIATGSLYENVIKMIAIDSFYQGENLTALVLTTLIQRLNAKGIEKYFLFTTQESKHYFVDFAFSLIYENQKIVMFENNINTIEEKLTKLKNDLALSHGTKAAIVMNCNPVTLGHLYLIETCAKSNDHVIIFLVEENKSVFSFETRMMLLKKATKHMTNVHILPSTEYIISSATFPTYFLKELNEVSLLFMELDISIFLHFFMRIFEIDYRYVGDEPLDPTTNAYNETMKQILKDQLIVINRLEKNSVTVSASFVRKLAKDHQYEVLKSYVPNVTYRYLKSSKGKAIFDEK